MDEKLKTQTFRFTNQFKAEGGDEEEVKEFNQQELDFVPGVLNESDEDSIQEEICDS